MKYLLLITEPRGDREARDEAQARALNDEMMAYGQSLARDGRLLASESLRPDRHGVRIQQRGGALQLTDGPFAEAREMIGGFFLVECASRDEAVELAKRCPAARFATVEVRECAPCYVN